jgi:hypothetical protein
MTLSQTVVVPGMTAWYKSFIELLRGISDDQWQTSPRCADWLVADVAAHVVGQLAARMLGNGMCTRPVELECRMESACETCAYFRTGPEFFPLLLRQRNHARRHGQAERAALFDGLVNQATEESA